MSHFLDRLKFMSRVKSTFADGHGETVNEDRRWENAYRARWQHDKVVRSTHGVNCTGSCSWKVYVKNGLITWETQQTDYPRTRPDLQPRASRLSQRRVLQLVCLFGPAREVPDDPGPPDRDVARGPQDHGPDRGLGMDQSGSGPRQALQGRARPGASCAPTGTRPPRSSPPPMPTPSKFGPDRLIGFSPIPAMSMVSYAAGARYLSLLGGACLSFYDWYCDLPPASPQVWGEQTDVPESADWYNSTYLMVWGSNVPQTRTPTRTSTPRSATRAPRP